MTHLTLWYSDGTMSCTEHANFSAAWRFMINEGDHVVDWETREILNEETPVL